MCGTFTTSSFRIWNKSTGIPSPPLALFIVCFLRPTWLHIPGCLALGEWSHHFSYLVIKKIFLDNFVYSCHLFQISSALLGLFLSFIVPIFVQNVPLVWLIFLKRSLVFPILLLSSISLHWLVRKSPCSSLELCIQNGIAFLFSFAFTFSSFLSYL